MAVNYPSLAELLQAYQAGTPQPGQALQSGIEGYQGERDYQLKLAQLQQMNDLKKALFLEKANEFKQKQGLAEQKESSSEETKKQFVPVPGIQAPEGKVAMYNPSTGQVTMQDAPGTKPTKGMTSDLANARIQNALSTSLLNDPQYRKSQDIIDKGKRIENIGDQKDIVDNPGKLHILNDLIVGQAEGGKASLAGVTKLQNETAPQFAARVIEKITNEPQSAKADQWIKQIKDISQQDVKSAYTSIKSLSQAKGQALKRIYPGRENAIDEVSKNFADDYIKGFYGDKIPEFIIKDTSTSESDTGKVGTAEDFLKKHGLK